MKTYLIIVLALLCQTYSHAQQTNDVVILKDGTLIKGTISEYVPNGDVTIVLVDGRTKTYKSNEVGEIEEKKNRLFSTKDKGYFNTTTVGFLLGHARYGTQANFQFNLVNGYKHNKFFFGLGTGVETLNSQLFTPIFADISYQLREGKTSPFFTIQGGGTFNFGYDNDQENYYRQDNFKNGKFFGLGFGLKNHMNNNLAFVISAGYRYYDLKGSYINNIWEGGPDFLQQTIDTKAYLNRFNLKIGLLFN